MDTEQLSQQLTVLLYVAIQLIMKINFNVSAILVFNVIYTSEMTIHNILSGAACEAMVEQGFCVFLTKQENCDNNINSSNDRQLVTTDYAILCNLKMNLIANRWNTGYGGNDNLRAISYSDSTTYTSGNNIKILSSNSTKY